MTVSPSARRVLLAGIALIAAAWALTAPPRVPLYDGLIGPADDYRYLNPPPDAKTQAPPTTGSTTLDVKSDGSAAGFLQTSEQPPQVQFLVGQGALDTPAGSTSVILSAKAVPPPAPLPALVGRLDGNVYEVTATADKPGTVTVHPGGTPPTMVMRGPPGSSSAVIYRYTADTGAWTALHTVPIGGQAPDIVAANTDQLGFFALALGAGNPAGPGGGSGGGHSSSGGFPVVAVVVPLGVLVLLGAVIVPIRLARSRR